MVSWRVGAMAAAVPLREDFSAVELRPLAKRSTDAHQSRRLLSLAAVRDGMDRGEAAKIGGDGPPDLARLGSWLQRGRSGRALRQLDEAETASFAGSTGRVGPDRRDRSAPRGRRRRALAAG